MPCYEVRTMSVEFKADNRTLLDAAIKADDLRVDSQTADRISLCYGAIVLNLSEGTATVRGGNENLLNRIKRTYATEAIKAAAKQAQWNVKWTGSNKASATKLKW